MRTDPLQRAIKAAGGVAKLAERLEITSAAVAQWRQVPPGRLLAVAEATGIPAHELRPDIVPAPPEAA